ncbi:MAG TPA: ArsI/CadI family heavy metal resistance metalloenzyme [Mycobacteriales bacterium]|nr:ArsI/CadI family heavy metal resistance metalloenzyme [Mycobacteriales bacterium]
MPRIQLALDVDDLDAAVGFYSRLLGTGPAKRRPGYANFAVAEPPLKLVLLENPGRGGGLNHLGIEVDSPEAVREHTERLRGAGLATATEDATTCCWAQQDKVWVAAPDGEAWEIYTVLADSETFGAGPSAGDDAVCCAATAPTSDAAPDGVAASCC